MQQVTNQNPLEFNGPAQPIRWVCECQDPSVLLATYSRDGAINIRVRDRYWHVCGRVHTVCPKCGSEHSLNNGKASVPA